MALGQDDSKKNVDWSDVTAMVHCPDEDDMWLANWPFGPLSTPLPAHLPHDNKQGK